MGQPATAAQQAHQAHALGIDRLAAFVVVGMRQVFGAPGVQTRLEVAVGVLEEGPVKFRRMSHLQSPSNTGVCLATKAW